MDGVDQMAVGTGDEGMLDELQRETFQYFVHETNPETGLIRDRTAKGSPASIAAVGLGLASYVVGVERGLMSREEAVGRTLTTLRFLWRAPQGSAEDASGRRGFFYHFLDMETGRRAIGSEVSTIDTTFLMIGVLVAAAYYDRSSEEEAEIRQLADSLYRRVDWCWALDNGATVSHGWRPEGGFIPYRWDSYSEALILYALALGSPTHAIPEEAYEAWTKGFEWKGIYGRVYVHAGPLFIHQLSHVWLNLKGIRDKVMEAADMDYFENSRRATYVQQAYAVDNPKGFREYGEYTWGITASAGPGDHRCRVDGRERRFYGYLARGVPEGPDDGTLSPWAVVASLPFAPEIVLPTIRHYDEAYPQMRHAYGFRCSFNPTFPTEAADRVGWVSDGYYGLNQGPIVLMIDNFRTGLIWSLVEACSHVVRGLRRAGFSGGWLSRSDVGRPGDGRGGAT